MLNGMLLHLLVVLVVSQLRKVRTNVHWQDLKNTVDAQVRDLVPGTWFDEDAVTLTNHLIDGLANVLKDEDDLKRFLDDMATAKWADAVEVVKKLLLAGWQPASDGGKAVLAMLTAPPAPAPVDAPVAETA